MEDLFKHVDASEKDVKRNFGAGGTRQEDEQRRTILLMMLRKEALLSVPWGLQNHKTYEAWRVSEGIKNESKGGLRRFRWPLGRRLVLGMMLRVVPWSCSAISLPHVHTTCSILDTVLAPIGIAPGFRRLRAESPELSPCILTKNNQK